MNPPLGSNRQLVLSYLALRKAVGIIGVMLPFGLAIGKSLAQGPGIEDSISYYYYTDMRSLLVASLCAIGMFLVSTRGYDNRDKYAGWFACVFAIGVAFCPTTRHENPSGLERFIGWEHLLWAASLFGTLAYFSWFLFTETDPTKKPTPRKLVRNIVYRVCAVVIVVSILLDPVFTKGGLHPVASWPDAVFCLESLAVFAFGVSWLVKGEAILKDQTVSNPAPRASVSNNFISGKR